MRKLAVRYIHTATPKAVATQSKLNVVFQSATLMFQVTGHKHPKKDYPKFQISADHVNTVSRNCVTVNKNVKKGYE